MAFFPVYAPFYTAVPRLPRLDYLPATRTYWDGYGWVTVQGYAPYVNYW